MYHQACLVVMGGGAHSWGGGRHLPLAVKVLVTAAVLEADMAEGIGVAGMVWVEGMVVVVVVVLLLMVLYYTLLLMVEETGY